MLCEVDGSLSEARSYCTDNLRHTFRLILKIQAISENNVGRQLWIANNNTIKLYKDLSTQQDKEHAIFTLTYKHA